MQIEPGHGLLMTKSYQLLCRTVPSNANTPRNWEDEGMVSFSVRTCRAFQMLGVVWLGFQNPCLQPGSPFLLQYSSYQHGSLHVVWPYLGCEYIT